MVMTQYGIVATSQAVASQAGAAILARGGSAVDAAIAANAALGVIEPMMNGVGGDLFAIVYDAKTKKLYGLNASGWAPKGMTIEALKAKGIVNEIPEAGIDSVTVPGAVAGWDALRRRFGKLLDGGGCGARGGAGGKRHRGAGDRCRELGDVWRSVCEEPRICARLSAGWKGAGGGTDLSQSRSGGDAAAHWRAWTRRLLQRADGGGDAEAVARAARLSARRTIWPIFSRSGWSR